MKGVKNWISVGGNILLKRKIRRGIEGVRRVYLRVFL